MSSHVITGRGDAVAPSDQLADAQQFLSSKKPNNFTFTHDVSVWKWVTLPSLRLTPNEEGSLCRQLVHKISFL